MGVKSQKEPEIGTFLAENSFSKQIVGSLNFPFAGVRLCFEKARLERESRLVSYADCPRTKIKGLPVCIPWKDRTG